VPLGVLTGATVTRDIPAGTLLSYADVELDASSTIVALRHLQDLLLDTDLPPTRLQVERLLGAA
jgi:predicted homoserine dehydrogenase-like protein